MKGWTKIKGAAVYACVSPRTIRTWFKKGLRFSRVSGGVILIKYSDIDEFLGRFYVDASDTDRVNTIANEVMRGIRAANYGKRIQPIAGQANGK